MQIYVINLDRAPDRYARMSVQFGKVGQAGALSRFAAIDAQAPDFHAAAYAPHSWRDRWELKLSEQAVFESHRAVWRQVAAGDAGAAIICEDDILVSSLFPAFLGALDCTRFGVVKLDGFNAARRYGAQADMNGWTVRTIVEPVPSAACYALSRTAAAQLLADSETYCETLDDFVFRTRGEIAPVQIFPAVTAQQMCCADPTGGTESLREAQDRTEAAKGPLPYRAFKELRRSLRKRKLRSLPRLTPELASDLPPLRP